MEFLANPDLKNVAQGASPTGSTKVAVLEGANNTIKYRSVDDIVSAGGGTTAPRDFQITLVDSMVNADPSILVYAGEDGWGFPWTGDTQAGQLLTGAKFLVPFKPANYRFSARCYTDVTYLDANGQTTTMPANGDFGVKFEYSTNNSTWTNIGSILFRTKVRGDLVTSSGTISISGTDTLFYIRALYVNTLNPTGGASLQATNFVANFWS